MPSATPAASSRGSGAAPSRPPRLPRHPPTRPGASEMNPPRLAAAVCLVMALAALAYALFSDPVPVDPGAPRTGASPIPLLAASVPPIGDFGSEFNVNPLNPFVPYEVRAVEVKAITNPGTKPISPVTIP